MKILRYLLALLLLAATTPWVAAEGVWDGTTETAPSGSGTAEDPYKLSTGAHIKWVHAKSDRWNKCYILTDNIDMGRHPLAASVGNPAIGHPATPFSGQFDGNGYTISNLPIPVYRVDDGTRYSYGLFGAIANGAVRNLCLDNFTVTFEEGFYQTKDGDPGSPLGKSGTTGNAWDLKCGILAGRASANAVIENIIITNSVITAEELSAPVEIHTLFVGGVVGDVLNGLKSGSYNAENNDAMVGNLLTIANIYAQVDIRLSKLHRVTAIDDGKKPQFNCGGIVGRLRRPSYTNLPDNIIYTGTIDAPYATISNTWGHARSSTNGKTLTEIIAGYVGEYNTDSSVPIRVIGDSKGDDFDVSHDKASATRFFYDYSLSNGAGVLDADGNYPIVAVTDSEPPVGYKGIRAFTVTPNPIPSAQDSYDPGSPASMSRFQGVNQGTLIDIADLDERNGIISLFNDYTINSTTGGNLLKWTYEDSRFKIIASEGLALEPTGYRQYHLTVSNPRFERYAIRMMLDDTILGYIETTPSGSIQTADYTLPSQYGSGTLKAYLCYSDTREPITVGPEFIYRQIQVNPDVDGLSIKLERKTVVKADGTEVTCYQATALYNGSEIISGGGSWSAATGNDGPLDGAVVDTDYAWIWHVSSDPSARNSFENTNLHQCLESERNSTMQKNWIIPFHDNRYYRVQFVRLLKNPDGSYKYKTDAAGNLVYINGQRVHEYEIILEDLRGPQRIIFVYNKSTSARGRALGYTSFTGRDASTGALLEDQTEFPDGDDSNLGYDPYHAVKTMARAYELLEPNGSRQDNIIVVMGYYYNPIATWNHSYPDLWRRNCTVTGDRGNLVHDGAIAMYVDADTGTKALSLQGATGFEEITWVGFSNVFLGDPALAHIYLYANLHDLYIGTNLKILGYENLVGTGTGSYGCIDGTKAPHITIMGGRWLNNGAALVYPEGNETPGYVTLTFNSGCFGRIIAAARNDGLNADHNIYGSIYNPHRAIVKVSISHNTIRTPDELNADGSVKSFGHVSDEYFKDLAATYTPTYDIGLLVGGQTDGTVYCESEISMNDGYVGRFISGNISYGREVNKPDQGETGINSFPTDSYFGSAKVTIEGGEIHELYGGSLGRIAEGESCPSIDAYFYGSSSINIKGGIVGSDLYGGGSGGTTGVGDERFHTDDTHIPFVYTGGGINEIKYGAWGDLMDELARRGLDPTDSLETIIPSISLARFDENGDSISVSLVRGLCEVNLYSGTIKGDVYGGGYGYSSAIHWTKASNRAGYLYGDCYVNMLDGLSTPPVVEGSIYGAGCGSKKFLELALAARNNTKNTYHDFAMTKTEDEWREFFGHLGVTVGDSRVTLKSGTVYGDVFGAGAGVTGTGFDRMGALIGNAYLTLDGATVNGNIFGGCNVASVYHHPLHADQAASGNTSVEILSGFVGNNIFGGCKGDPDTDSRGHVYGSTSINVTGGAFIKESQVYVDAAGTAVKNEIGEAAPKLYKRQPRTFNIYGGGFRESDVHGSTSVTLSKSLLEHYESILGTGDYDDARFRTAFNDLMFRRFCIYGAGFGELTRVFGDAQYSPAGVKAASVTIDVPSKGGIALSTGREIDLLIKGQTFFDIAGGGYSGDVGYWTKVDYETEPDGQGGTQYKLDDDGLKIPIESTRVAHHDITDRELTVDDYCEYVNGDVAVTVRGDAFMRKIIGGGFYSSVRSADTHIFSGTIREVYGGALLGYVHRQARLQIGTTTDDPAYADDPGQVAFNNAHLYILNSVYGGNDVKGIVGTQLWRDVAESGFDPLHAGDPGFGIEEKDGGPLFCSDTNPSPDTGVNLFIFGGNINGNVYGAGNGHYRGYYVPGWLRYEDGGARHYRSVRTNIPEYDDKGNITNYLRDEDGNILYDERGRARMVGNVYRSLPMVGSVNMHIGGNSEGDRVNIAGNVYGGGRSCTIGQWNTVLPFIDPRRLLGGGHLAMNLGSHVTVGGNLYLGVSGAEYATQSLVPDDIDIATFDGRTTAELDRLGEVAYDPWYFDLDKGYYIPGFPADGDIAGNYGIDAEHMFRGYMKKIEMNANVELTFYNDPYKLDADGVTHSRDSHGHLQRKHWVPGEIAIAGWRDPATGVVDKQYVYDSSDIVVNSLFVGGECGTMSNNTMMRYDYDHNVEVPATELDPVNSPNLEKWGSIYRLALPYGLTVRDKVVGGSENAIVNVWKYADDGHSLIKTDAEGNDLPPMFSFEGGLVTQACDTYDMIVWTDRELHKLELDPAYDCPIHGWDAHADPALYTLPDGDPDFDEYVMQTEQFRGTKIYRYNYHEGNPHILNQAQINPQRYSLAYTVKTLPDGTVDASDVDALGNQRKYGFTGPRTDRQALRVYANNPDEENEWENTAVKLTVFCDFQPLPGSEFSAWDTTQDLDPENHFYYYGGIIYGGCFNSGRTLGDVVINCGSNLIGHLPGVTDEAAFERLSSMRYNVGRIFGGGYGKESTVEGDTYINLLHNFKGMNVFGGGCRGDVVGTASINYVGAETQSYIYGALYGGGLYGSVGAGNPLYRASHLRLYSGNIDKVYGGSCLGNLYGRSQIDICESVTPQIDHLDYDRIRLASPDLDEWAGSRLIVGSVFGGNDITGNIYLTAAPTPQPADYATDDDYQAALAEHEANNYSTTIHIWEIPETSSQSSQSSQSIQSIQSTNHESPEDIEDSEAETGDNPGKDTPGAVNGYNGFPFIGNLYGGSNGNYGRHDPTASYYMGGTVELAVGEGNQVMRLNLGGNPTPGTVEGKRPYDAYELPHLDYTRILLEGGTVINCYGGGDNSTVNERTLIRVNYPADAMDARAGFASDAELTRVWNACHLESTAQITEAASQSEMPDGSTATIFNDHVFHIFGGNNHADMDIQPTWDLRRGHVGSIYSGGNFGQMTYCATETDGGITKPLHGISLRIDSDSFHARYVYGGGRVGDVAPRFYKWVDDPDPANAGVKIKQPIVDAAFLNADYDRLLQSADVAAPLAGAIDDFYGVQLEVNRGVVDHVYGGNDVSGNVDYGTRVKITGAISGDVYCAGNGNYRYQYDPSIAPGTMIEERYDDVLGRYFVLPQNPIFGGDSPQYSAETILAINSYRPNVDRSYLSIEGAGGKTAYVCGNVYCGGNSSTVKNTMGTDGAVQFEIGDNVILNGVFMGSNGESLADGETMYEIEVLNNLELVESNGLPQNYFDEIPATRPASVTTLTDIEYKRLYDDAIFHRGATDKSLYPLLLDLYMRAVEVTEVPKGFEISDALQNAYIGDFFVGGNCGSMMTDKTIHISFPRSLVIYGKVVGGSNNANVVYKEKTHSGGLRKPLRPGYDEKVHLRLMSVFEPWKLVYPEDGDLFKIRLDADVVKDDNGLVMFPNGKCMVYGGCYNSGLVVGDIRFDNYSDLLAEYTDVDTEGSIGKALNDAVKALDPSMRIDGTVDADGTSHEKKQLIINGVDAHNYRSFGIIGGGYGINATVVGDIKVRQLPCKVNDAYDPATWPAHPSASTIYGGSEMGSIIGNTYLEVRDGMVLTDTYGGSEARVMFGSTHTIIGWPDYYRVKKGVMHKFKLQRADNLSRGYREKLVSYDRINKDTDPRPAVIEYISLREGELLTPAVYRQIVGYQQDGADVTFSGAELTTFLESCFDEITDDTPANFAAANRNDEYEYKPCTWDDIDISIGDKRSRTDYPDSPQHAPYYGHGNVYGGGFVSASSTVSIAGQYTVRRFRSNAHPFMLTDPANTSLIGYGGNSMIMIWDNKENADTDYAPGDFNAAGNRVTDHVSIGTGRYVPVTKTRGQDVLGTYVYTDAVINGKAVKRYVHQPGHKLTADDCNADGSSKLTYYSIESDGGIYGGGRQVFTEGFRSCDMAYYGYALGTPQFPKLLNTVQRLDLLSFTDCCLYLQGANDFTTTTVDGTLYSLTRIGEMQMRSSLDPNDDLDPGARETSGLFNIVHNNSRTRNYVAFFNSVLYVASLTSSQSFDDPYRGANGKRWNTGDWGDHGNTESEFPIPAGYDYTPLDPASEFSYIGYKRNRLHNYYACGPAETEAKAGDNQNVRARTTLERDQRNVGTAANMIGINNGFTLNIMGAVTPEAEGLKDETYYGPIFGVFEIKLLTLAQNEGGGYIFALNRHDESGPYAEGSLPDALQTTGNFVFPGAAYLTSADAQQRYNYINDDCFPMGLGWEHYYNWDSPWAGTSGGMQATPGGRGVSPRHENVMEHREGGASRPAMGAASSHGDCNELEDVHFWFVNGTNFYYNLTLTAYTYNEEKSFTLDANDQMVYLYGIAPGSDVRVKSIVWDTSTNEDPDIVNISADPEADPGAPARDYRLYLSIDGSPASYHTSRSDEGESYTQFKDNSFVMPIPRADYDPEASPATADQWVDMSGIVNKYGDADADAVTPLVGISLRDMVDNTTKAYYERHLKEPEKVSIELVTGSGDSEFTYTINLTVKYLLGPSISGLPVIENCALSGEYIYANSFGVIVDIDDASMAVTDRNWYICDPRYPLDTDAEIREVILNINNPDPASRTAAFKLTDDVFDGDRQVHIPAYMHRNGWNLIYEVVANNMSFYLTPTHNRAEWEEQHKPYRDHLVVHNYHRMRPYDGTSLQFNPDGTIKRDDENNPIPKYEDLQLTAGCRLYIEDDADMAYFYEWLDALQDAPERFTPAGDPIDPQYGEGLVVILMADVNLPDMSKLKLKHPVTDLRFRGVFHGNGYNINMGDNMLFLGYNSGWFYNTGFISTVNSNHDELLENNALVFHDNLPVNGEGGWIEDCFYYNAIDQGNGYIVPPSARGNGTIINCIRTSKEGKSEVFDTAPHGVVGLRHVTLEQFKFGEAAYNLNRFYLNERYLEGIGGVANLAPGDDDPIRTKDLVEKYYRDGVYRYAHWSAEGNANALRTHRVPNYRDYRGIRIAVPIDIYDNGNGITGLDATYHNTLDIADETRAKENAVGDIELDSFGFPVAYVPNLEDYIFYGQDLSVDRVETAVPHAVTPENRVYRATGFYGEHEANGFHFNLDAVALRPGLTAIDFTGWRMAVNAHQSGSPYKKGLQVIDDDNDGVAEEHCYYPPLRDLPSAINSFTTSSEIYDQMLADGEIDKIPDDHSTRNLLLYTWPDDPLFDQYKYIPSTPEQSIYAHLVHPVAGAGYPDISKRPKARFIHLVDRENFNCPIAVEVTDSLWYQRRPAYFADKNEHGYSGWEGLALPFTVHKVYSEPDGDVNRARAHGELSHFYGIRAPKDTEVASHEYWLRKFVGIGEGKALFDRPAGDNDVAAGNPAETLYNTIFGKEYRYGNPYFSIMYGDFYGDGTTHKRDEYTAAGRVYEDYPLVTARFPYIVAWPGTRFREFDLSDKFYNLIFPGTPECEQVINFIAFGDGDQDDHAYVDAYPQPEGGREVILPVTDYAQPIAFTHDGTILRGTFTRVDGDDAYLAVIDQTGESFKAVSAGTVGAVDPFRVYMTTASRQAKPLPISSRGIDRIGDGDDDDDQGDGDPAAELEIYVDFNQLVIMSPFEEPMELPLCDTAGRLIQILQIHDGENRYDLPPGAYVTRDFKFMIF